MNEIAWKTIDRYFNENPQILVKHHLDSYNDFFSKGIINIFKNTNPLRLLEELDEETQQYKYECNIYFGGKDGTKFRIGKPTIYDHDTKEMRILYPNEARLKNLTYGCDIFFDIEVEYSLLDEDTGKYIYKNIEPPMNTDFMKNKFLTRLPIMLHSKICSLYGLTEQMKMNLGEGKYDTVCFKT